MRTSGLTLAPDDPATVRTRQAPLPVLFVESYPQALAGQQETLLALLHRCAAAGLAPTVAAPGDGPFLDRLRAAGVPVVVLPQPAGIAAYGGAIYRYTPKVWLRSCGQTLGYIARLRRWIGQGDFAVVFCNDMRGLLTFGCAARLLGLPVIIWDKLDKPHGFYDWFQLPLANRNLVIAEAVRRKYPRWQRRLWSGRIDLVRDGIDLDRFRPAAAAERKRLGLPRDAVVLGIVGSVTARKGHDLLLPAFAAAQAKLPNLHLAVIGDPPPEDERFCDRLRQGTTRNVHWLGHRDDVPELLAEIDILVSPSRHEGMGRVNVEAMAMGLPVIGAAQTGIAEVIVDGETGVLVDPTDGAALEAAILRLARDPDLRRRMGEAGRARARAHFDIDRQLAAVLSAIKEIAVR